METYDFSYGTQYAEFERPEMVSKGGFNLKLVGSTYTLIVQPSISKVVVKCSR